MKSFVPEMKGNLIKILLFSFAFSPKCEKNLSKRLSENIFFLQIYSFIKEVCDDKTVLFLIIAVHANFEERPEEEKHL